LKVTSSNEYCNGGYEFALLDLTLEVAALALRRIRTLREQKNLDPDIDETYFWAYFVECYFDPWAELPGDEKEVESMGSVVEEILDVLDIEDNEVVRVPESFQVPPRQCAVVESEQMIVRDDSISFTAIPRYASLRVQTAEIPIAMLEAAVAAAL
jgi:hypothetical protein